MLSLLLQGERLQTRRERRSRVDQRGNIMSTIIDGHDPIEVRMAIQTAEDRLADFMQLGDAVRRLMIALLPPEEVEQFKSEHPAFEDVGTISLCMDLRHMAEAVQPGEANFGVEKQGEEE